jgi:hypothetical protein
MANRYMSNLRSNASSGYYDTISAIVAADSQARSAAIQSQYGAMSNSITVIADSMIKGMNSAANYQLEQEKLITARRVAESEMAAKATEMQIREQEAESQRLMSQARLDQATRANQKEARQQAIAPLAREYVQGAAAVAAEMAQADSYQKREEIRKKFSEDFRRKSMDLEAGKSELMPGVSIPGAYGAFSSSEGVIAVDLELSKQVASVGSARLRDPKTGLDMSQRRIAETFSNPDSPLLAQEMAYRATLDPEAPVEVRQQGATYMKEKLASADSTARMRATLLDWETRGSPEMGIYNQERERGATVYEAFETAKTSGAAGTDRLNTLFGINQGPGTTPPALTLVGAPRPDEASATWGIRDAELAKLRKSNKFGVLGLPEASENSNLSVVSDGYKRTYEKLSRVVANPKSEAEYNQARSYLDEITKNPTSQKTKDILLGPSGATNLEEATAPWGMTKYEGMTPDYKRRMGDKAKKSLEGFIEMGGSSWVPPGASSGYASITTLTADLGPLTKEAAAFKIDPRKALNPETRRPFRSVAEMVLWERENSAGTEFRTNAEILAGLRADGLVTGGSSAPGVPVTDRGRNTVLASRLSTTTQPNNARVPAMIGATASNPAPQ